MTRASGGGGVTELIDLMPVDAAGLAHNLVRRLKMVRGRTAVALTCRPAFDYARSGHRAHQAGDAVVFAPASAGEFGPCSGAGYGDAALEATLKSWQRWIGRSTSRGRWKEMVDRSDLALELLTSVRHGSLVAAPATRFTPRSCARSGTPSAAPSCRPRTTAGSTPRPSRCRWCG